MKLTKKDKVMSILRDMLIQGECKVSSLEYAQENSIYLKKGDKELCAKLLAENKIEVNLLKAIIQKLETSI